MAKKRRTLEDEENFIGDLYSYCCAAGFHGDKPETTLATVLHNLGEWSKNRNEDWFCPRTEGSRNELKT